LTYSITILNRDNVADVLGLRQLYLASRVNTFHWLDVSAFQLSDFDKQTEEEFVLVAQAGAEVVGFISIWEADNFIHHLYVSQNHQGLGIGSHLLSSAAGRFGYPLKLKCLTRNKPALDFYLLKGFVILGTGADADGSYYSMELGMVKDV
jgi:GNAT superfamily N-acetyltransferase